MGIFNLPSVLACQHWTYTTLRPFAKLNCPAKKDLWWCGCPSVRARNQYFDKYFLFKKKLSI